jgi:hypothetical protein
MLRSLQDTKNSDGSLRRMQVRICKGFTAELKLQRLVRSGGCNDLRVGSEKQRHTY